MLMKLGYEIGGGHIAASGPACLDSILASIVFEVDATISKSYSGSGTSWKNVTLSPADGEAQTAYDFTNASAASLFTGSAGSQSACFNMAGDSTNIFTLSANTALTNALHKTTGGSDFTLIIAGQVSDIDASGKVMVGTQSSSAHIGLSANWSASDTFRLQQYGDTTEAQKDSVETYADGKTFLAVFAHKHSTNTTRITVNGVMTEVAHSFDTTATDATDVMHIGGHPAAAFLPAGFRLYTVALANEYISRADEEMVRALLESRHGRSYTDAGAVSGLSFTDETEIALSTVETSDIKLIRGFSADQAISISGDGSPQYRICEDSACSTVLTDWTASAGTIEQNRYLQLRGTSSDTESTQFDIDITVGAASDTWSITTVVPAYNPMGDLVSSTVFDLDATVSDSYSGSGTTWANLEATPADSAAQTAYDFSNNGFTFTGSAGSAGAYWLADGANQFDLGGGNTTFLNNLPKTTGGTNFWFAMAFRAGSVTQRLCHTGAATNVPLLGVFMNASNILNLFQRGDTASANTSFGSALSAGTDYVVIVSHDSASNNIRYWINTATASNQAQTYNATTTNAGAFTIGAESDGGNPLVNGVRVYAVSMGNAYLDNTGAAAIFAEYEARHGRDYTP